MYKKLLLKNGDILSDVHLNHIQNGVLETELNSDKFRSVVAKILTYKGIPAYDTDSFDSLSQKINMLGTGLLPPPEGGDVEAELIDIRKTVESGQVQLLVTSDLGVNVTIRFWTLDSNPMTIDWGDGTKEDFKNGEYCKHIYKRGTGKQYSKNDEQWVITAKALGGNVFYRFMTHDNSSIKWFVSKDVYFTNVYGMFSTGDTTSQAPSGLKYVDFIGGGLSPDTYLPMGSSDASYCFKSCSSLERITGSINTSNATSMYQFYCACKQLISVPPILSLEKSKNNGYVFNECRSLANFPNIITTKNCESAAYMYRYCEKLTSIPDLDLSSCTNATEMFAGCFSLERAHNIFNTGNIKEAGSMFYNCSSLNKVPNVLDLGSAISVHQLFRECVSLVDAPSVIHLDNAVSMYSLFYNCKSLKNPPTVINAPMATNADGMFAYCSSLRRSPTTINLPKAITAYDMFLNCNSMTECLEVVEFPVLQNGWSMFNGCEVLLKLPKIIRLPEAKNINYLFSGCSMITETPEILEISSAQKVNDLFRGCNMLSTIHFDTLEFPNALEITAMFYGCKNITTPPNIIAPQATSTRALFYGCERLETSKPLNLPKSLSVDEMYRFCKMLQVAEEINAPLATSWLYTYRECNILHTIKTIGGPLVQDIYHMAHNSPMVANIPTYLDFSNVTRCTEWIYTGDPCRAKGDFVFKGIKCDFFFRNCRTVTSIRIENMDPLCGNLDFRSCALGKDAINLLFGDLIQTSEQKTINVAGNPGAKECDISIAEAKGWVVTI